MALSTMALNSSLKVRIVPVGLNYFHPDRFRSRAVIEFGPSIEVDPTWVQMYRDGGQSKRESVSLLMDLVFKSLRELTVTAPDYDSLMVIQAARRLYQPIDMKMDVTQTLKLTRRFAMVSFNQRGIGRKSRKKNHPTNYNRR